MIKSFWDALGAKLGRAARAGLMVGATLIVLATAVAGWWLLRPDYQVLFADLTPQDTAAMTAELDRQKIPYVLSDQGGNVATIMVDKAEVYKTRIKVMGKDIPLHGTVGFELFNNSDFGMTEFAQKINYQRALQGELTRTILSLAEIRDARVLLALPEQGLFKQAGNRAKASVTLTMKPGQRLGPERVLGIQRLVAAAVPGIATQDVTLVDQTGVALTRGGDGEGEGAGGGAWRLDLKKDTEAYLSRKAVEVLERALGPGQAMASVDVTLDMDRVQRNTDEVLSVPGRAGGAPTGVVVRERETSREMEAPLGRTGSDAAPAGGGSRQNEVEYAVGHRVEQVIGQPGSIRRIQVAVVVQKPLGAEQKEQLRSMVAASVGVLADRGDAVVVQTLDGLRGAEKGAQVQAKAADPAKAEEEAAPAGAALPERPAAASRSVTWSADLGPLLALFLILGIAWVVYLISRPAPAPEPAPELSEAERRAALAKVKTWMQERPAGSDMAPRDLPGGGA